MIAEVEGRVRAFVSEHRLLERGAVVVVAVSGGADSLCLLYVLAALSADLDLRLHVAHLDHALRPESAGDAAFVACEACRLGLTCTSVRRDVPALARERRLSVESAARLARYAFLREVAAAQAATAIATGHTRDDQAETVLFHLIRGSGLAGLAGMRPRFGDIIRPLLPLSCRETEAYCAALGLTPRSDPSNMAPEYTRNRLRHEALPLLDSIQPAAAANIAAAARRLSSDLQFVERCAAAALDFALEVENAGRLRFDVGRWRAADAALWPHMLRLALVRLLGSAEGFAERHYQAIGAALASDHPNARIDLPKGLMFARDGGSAALAMASTQASAPLDERTLAVPGSVVTPYGTLTAELVTAPDAWSGVPATTAYLDPGAAGSALRVRSWRPGDRMHPLGAGGMRKVQDILVDRKVPRRLRHRLALVEGPRGLAWIAGVCTAEPYRARPGEQAVRLTWQAIEE
ncbi:MAG TPA: tRNA lysidine(34) synthetase TilS [Chloroflexota bacterium]|nr:tRNA lysidine(34) synthetase TilS [Chloroflexota bacterium]